MDDQTRVALGVSIAFAALVFLVFPSSAGPSSASPNKTKEELHASPQKAKREAEHSAVAEPSPKKEANGVTRLRVEPAVQSWKSSHEVSLLNEEDELSWKASKPAHVVVSNSANGAHNEEIPSPPAWMSKREASLGSKSKEQAELEGASWITKGEPSFIGTVDAPSFNEAALLNGAPTPIRPKKSQEPLRVGGNRTLLSANAIVSHVAVEHGEPVFVYPCGDHIGFLGEPVKQDARVMIMETRSGAGEVLLGAARASGASSSRSTTALLPSRVVERMTRALTTASKEKLPIVLHVACSHVSNEDASVQSDYANVLNLRDSAQGVALLASTGPRDALAASVAAHHIARVCATPVVHFFDGSRGLNQLVDVDVPSEVAQMHRAHGHHARHEVTGTPEEKKFQSVVNALEDLHLTPFSYVGPQDAEIVVVTLGSASRSAERAVHEAPVGTRIGSLSVLLLRPWSSQAFIDALPPNATRLCVIDEGNAGRALFRDVATALLETGSSPRITAFPAHAARNARGVTPDSIRRLLECVAEGAEDEFGSGAANGEINIPLAGSYSSTFKHALDASQRRLVVSTWAPHRAATITEHAAVQVANALIRAGKSVDVLVTDDALKGMTLVELCVYPGTADPHSFEGYRAALEPGEADAVVLLDAGKPTASPVDVVGLLRQGGALILAPAGSREAAAPLSSSQRRRLSAKGAKISVFPSEHDVEEAGSEELDHNFALLPLLAGLYVASSSVCESALTHLIHAVQKEKFEADRSMDYQMLNNEMRMIEAVPQRIHAAVVASAHQTSSLGNNSTVDAFWSSRPTTPGNDSLTYDDAASQAGHVAVRGNSGAVDNHVATYFGIVPRAPGLVHVLLNDSQKAAESASIKLVPNHRVAWNILFKDAFATDSALRPKEHSTHQVRLSAKKRLTPLTYERNIFHLEFDIAGTDLTYAIGDALGVFGHNDAKEVDAFVAAYNASGGKIDPDSFVAWHDPKNEHSGGLDELVSVRNLLVQHLDLFGRPSKKFYLWLADHATSRYEHLKLVHTGTDDAEGFKLGVSETLTFADILLQHPSARPSMELLAQVVPTIKARHYSIASSMKFTPRSVHLLVVEVDWVTPTGRKRYGQCTRYLANLPVGSNVTVDVQPSVLRLPPNPKQPIIMAGLGTGMAPFRAFVQERKVQRDSGIDVGPIVLYFGARHRHEEWLYGEEWDAYAAEGLVTRLGLAFSRDQREKVYIQHKIKEDGPLLQDLFGNKGGFFYLCGPTWPVPDVRDAVAAGIDPAAAALGDVSVVDRLRDEGRYILEVY